MTASDPLNDERRSGFTCPRCRGALVENDFAGAVRLSCDLGHTIAAEGLLATQRAQVESTLWIALRALEEAIGFRRRMANRMREQGDTSLSAKFGSEAADFEQQAATLRRVLLNRS